MVTVKQMKAARAMLGLSQKQLAEQAGIAMATLNNIEREVQTDPKTSTLRAIQGALEAGGIEFVESSGKSGVFLKSLATSARIVTILIVDDSTSDRRLYRGWLGKVPNRNYEVVEAESAAAGFESFARQRPDCVILDFMMRGADGFQLLRKLKREPIELPPVIFITGMHNEILEESARAHGVHACLSKQALTQGALHAVVEGALHG